MTEKMRQCLGCRRFFVSDSPANRFCKSCKKRRGPLRGTFEPLDPDHLPLPIAREIRFRYYAPDSQSSPEREPRAGFSTVPRDSRAKTKAKAKARMRTFSGSAVIPAVRAECPWGIEPPAGI